jgi:hypothetical protein
VKNFTTSWSDGLAFNALIHRWRSQLFDFHNIARKHPNARLEHAFRVAQEHLGIERLLDPEGKWVFAKCLSCYTNDALKVGSESCNLFSLV